MSGTSISIELLSNDSQFHLNEPVISRDKISRLQNDTSSSFNTISDEICSKIYISSPQKQFTRSRQRKMNGYEKKEAFKSEIKFLLSNYSKKIEYSFINKKKQGAQYSNIKNNQKLSIYFQPNASHQSPSIYALNFLRINRDNTYSIIRLLIIISKSLDQLAFFELCVPRLSLQNFLIQEYENQIKVKQINFRHILMFYKQEVAQEQKLLEESLKQMICNEINKKELRKIIKKLSDDFTIQALHTFYGIYYQLIINQTIQILKQSQLKQNQEQLLVLLKKFQCFGEGSKEKFTKQLEYFLQNLKRRQKNQSSLHNYSIPPILFTRKSLNETYPFFEEIMTKNIYSQYVINPILSAQKKYFKLIPNKQMSFIVLIIEIIYNKVLQIDSQSDRNELNQMILLLQQYLKPTKERQYNKNPQFYRINQEYSKRYNQHNFVSYKQERSFIRNKILPSFICEEQKNLQKVVEADQSKMMEQFGGRQQRQIIEDISVIKNDQSNSNNNFFDEYSQFMQYIQENQNNEKSIQIFKNDLIMKTDLYKSTFKNEKTKILHDILKENRFQSKQIELIVKQRNFNRGNHTYQSIAAAITQKYQNIKSKMMRSKKLFQIMRWSHYVYSSYHQDCSKSCYLIVDHYFRHQYQSKVKLKQILEEDEEIVMNLFQCSALIQMIRKLIRQQICKVYRKFKEQIILEIFRDPANFKIALSFNKKVETLAEGYAQNQSCDSFLDKMPVIDKREKIQQDNEQLVRKKEYRREYVLDQRNPELADIKRKQQCITASKNIEEEQNLEKKQLLIKVQISNRIRATPQN